MLKWFKLSISSFIIIVGSTLLFATPDQLKIVPGLTTLNSILVNTSAIITRDNLIATSSNTLLPGLTVQNTTPSTVSVTAQWSPTIGLIGHGWDTDDAVDRETSCYWTQRPVSAATVGARIQLLCQVGTGGYTQVWECTNVGNCAYTGSVTAGASSAFAFNGRSTIQSAADGELDLRNSGGNSFTSLKIVADVIYNAGTATISSGCGTTPAAPVGNASAFSVTVGAGGDTACVIAFTTSFTNTPHCIASDRTTANLMRISSAATNGITVSGVMVAADVLDVVCMGHWQ